MENKEILKREKTTKDKWFQAISVILHIASIFLLIGSAIVPIIKPLITNFGFLIAKLLIVGIFAFIWFAIGVVSLFTLFTSEKFNEFLKQGIQNIMGSEDSVAITFDPKTILICSIISFVLVFVSLIFLKTYKDTLDPKKYKRKRRRRIFFIIVTLFVTVACIFAIMRSS